MPSVGIHAEFVVAAVEVLDECVPGTEHSCRAESCQAAHGPQSGRQKPVIGFDGVICVLLGDVARGGYQLLDHSQAGRCPVGGHLGRAQAVFEGAGEEPAGGGQIPLLGDHHVDDLAVLVDRPV